MKWPLRAEEKAMSMFSLRSYFYCYVQAVVLLFFHKKVLKFYRNKFLK